MAKITTLKIQSRDKERCNLYLDGEFAFGISVESVYKYGLKVGQDLTKDKIDELLVEDELKIAYNKALNYATKGLKTYSQVKTNLEKKEYSIKTINTVLEKLKSIGVIDDVEYAKRYIESVCKTQGKKLIEYKLRQKGVKKSDIDYAFSCLELDLKESAYSVLNKRMKTKQKTKEELSKAYKYLVGRGFSYEEVTSAVNKYKLEIDQQDEEF